jgi:hypothetical protein
MRVLRGVGGRAQEGQSSQSGLGRQAWPARHAPFLALSVRTASGYMAAWNHFFASLRLGSGAPVSPPVGGWAGEAVLWTAGRPSPGQVSESLEAVRYPNKSRPCGFCWETDLTPLFWVWKEAPPSRPTTYPRPLPTSTTYWSGEATLRVGVWAATCTRTRTNGLPLSMPGVAVHETDRSVVN